MRFLFRFADLESSYPCPTLTNLREVGQKVPHLFSRRTNCYIAFRYHQGVPFYTQLNLILKKHYQDALVSMRQVSQEGL